jgi:hypothetical protein
MHPPQRREKYLPHSVTLSQQFFKMQLQHHYHDNQHHGQSNEASREKKAAATPGLLFLPLMLLYHLLPGI